MNLDADILLWINGHNYPWLDEVMWIVSNPKTWIPLYVVLVALLAYRYRDWRAMIFVLAAFGIAVGLSDYMCSGIIKPLVCRLRPTHEPAIDPIHLVHGYAGGLYGFCSSHAANSMAVALLFSLLYRKKTATVLLMGWVAVVCYSRMYLGVHYPGDIVAGLFIGALFAVLVYWALARWQLRVDDVVAQQGDS